MKIGIIGDTHIMWKQPLARLDDFRETMKYKLEWLRDIFFVKEKVAFVVNAGDTLDEARSYYANEINSFCDEFLFPTMGAVGNHDLVDNTMKNYNISGIATLQRLGIFSPIKINGDRDSSFCDEIDFYGFHYGDTIQHREVDPAKINIAVYHGMIVESECTRNKELNAKDVLKEFSEYDLIVSGHNHKTILQKHRGRILVNPGSVFRLTAAQVDHKPVVYVYDTETKEISEHFLPIVDGVVSRLHIEEDENREQLLNEFTTPVKTGNLISVDFEENISAGIIENDIESDVEEEVYNIVGSVRHGV